MMMKGSSNNTCVVDYPTTTNSSSFNNFFQDDLLPDLLNLPSDMETFMAMENIEEVSENKNNSLLLQDILTEVGVVQDDSVVPEVDDYFTDCTMDSNESLIDEVESFLQSVSGEPTLIDSDSSVTDVWDIKEENSILKAMTSGNVVHQDQDLAEDDFAEAFATSVVGKNGENVIIIVAPSSPTYSTSSHTAMSDSNKLLNIPVLSPAVSYTTDISDIESSYSDHGSPQHGLKATRKKYQRKEKPRPPIGPYPKEKGERKKAQNRSAAFKYREKKKAEQDAADGELTAIMERNCLLKKRLADMNLELKCLKNLMSEMGVGVAHT